MIYCGSDLLVATIETNESLPHLTVGNGIQVLTENYSGTPGKILEVKRVEVMMSYANNQLSRNDIHVYCVERERNPAQ